MAPTRRRLLAGLATTTLATGGCIHDPGRGCPGATVTVTLSPAESVDDSLVFDPEERSAGIGAVLEAARGDGEGHVEHCVVWSPDGSKPGPSSGLRELGDRVEAHADVDLAERVDAVEQAGDVETVVVDARYDGDPYRLEIRIEPGDQA